ncbi:HEAT repeat domain-containing protein [Paenibacillus sp. GCM10023252]|uniref:HEAT repeat domain-containing protein n=1 Tax=Paenibacillus sp. GCM10023252 TaxID=3252649 RepID=UPI00360BCD23
MGQDAPLLLTDEQMRSFILNGYLLLSTDFTPEFHERLVEQLNHVYKEEGNPGNNILPRIRDLQRVFEHPVITGALTSVLGRNYLLHTHRHGHYNAVSTPGGWHKDSYWGHARMRNHHPWWAMIMYFPQDTPVELGPTGVMPGTQYESSRTFAEDESTEEVQASGQAGTFALIHYDIWHRSTPNLLGKPRYMLKFEFMRTEVPVSPTWNNKQLEWDKLAAGASDHARNGVIAEEVWSWLCGRVGGLAGTKQGDQGQLDDLKAQLEREEEKAALQAAYTLARYGEPGVQVLLQALHHEEVAVSRTAAYGLSTAGGEAVSGLTAALGDARNETVIHAAHALGELREYAVEAIPQLQGLLQHSSAKVRRAAADVLGMFGGKSSAAEAAVSGLIEGLSDEDAQVRFMSALSLTRYGKSAAAAVPHLAQVLEDDNRYVRGHALEALRYIGTTEANEILMRELFNSRWCSSTTPASTF